MNDGKMRRPTGSKSQPRVGNVSAAPNWFQEALADTPTSHRIVIAGCDIHYLRWGGEPAELPGILFVHGGGAHARWWSFIAPFFAADRPVAAIDLSGMGDSGRRDDYAADLRVEEIAGVLNDAALGSRPIVVGHSFGGYMTMCYGRRHGANLNGAVIVDSPVRPPRIEEELPRHEFARRKASYPDFDSVIGRFRLMPAQPCENDYIVDFIARNSVTHGADGWTWKFDLPAMGARRFDDPFGEYLQQMACRKAFMYGANSALVTAEVATYMASLMGPSTPTICIPEAYHHVMLDQPLAFVAALRAVLADWQASDTQLDGK
jgi:pimeloyl-ACP methyl ester carboxylesterase